MALRDRIQDDMKAALRAQDKERLGTLRLIVAAFKQREIDERITLDDSQVIAVLNRMIKQRRESIAQYQAAGRDDLAIREQAEITVIQTYLPAALSDAEVAQLISDAIATSSAQSVRDIGKVMGLLKGQLQGRADLAAVSAQVKARLGG